jgi:cold shock CspA family protein
MKDRIIEGYLKGFARESNIRDLAESEAFEHFVNYCIISSEYREPFDFEEVSVGKAGDSVDGIGIFVNENLVLSNEAIDYFKNNLHRLDAKFVFIETKTSDKFDMGDIGNFLFAVRTFFGDEASNRHQIERFRLMKEHIYDSSVDMDGNPICLMYYVTTGIWKDDANLNRRIEAERDALMGTRLFSDVQFIPVDAERIRAIYRGLKRRIATRVVFEKHAILPEIHKVDEAYIGILPCSEYLRLVCDAEGNLIRTLFYDNVRDFQGHNPVNREIEDTVRDREQNDRFSLLNNGITIVAKSISKVGAAFTLKDYQIVNGCQTTHVLYRNRGALSDQVFIPIKLIVTSDMDVTNSIIKATNRQTEVKVEAFESLTPFHKKLEELYSCKAEKDIEKRLYYERRSKQYDGMGIREEQIISLSDQVKSFISMFLNEPHSTHRYYGELLKSNENRIFLDAHDPFPYYLSGYAFAIVTRLFREGKIPPFFRKFKHHMLMLFRLCSESSPLPYLDDKKIGEYCSPILALLQDEATATDVFCATTKTIQAALDAANYDPREATRLRAFTLDMCARTKDGKEVFSARANRQSGYVTHFNDIRGFGFIKTADNDSIFVHCTNVKGYEYLRVGQEVEFTPMITSKGTQALDVIVISS